MVSTVSRITLLRLLLTLLLRNTARSEDKNQPQNPHHSMHAYASSADIDFPPTGCRENLFEEKTLQITWAGKPV
jgi:hypothetical protein